VPEGWEVRSFSEIAEFVNGFAFKPHHWGKSGKPIVKIAELKNGITRNTPFHDGGDIPTKYHIRSGDILFSWSADLDVYIWAHGDALLNQHLFNVLPRDEYGKLFLFFSLKSHMPEFRMRSLGTTMRHIKRSALDEVKLIVPWAAQRDLFESQVAPIIEQILNLTARNKNLRQTRDLLLPRLVSGELDVSELDIDTGGSDA
jgi:type I restriction enzyme S subunit